MLSGSLHVLESLGFSRLKSLHASDNSLLDLIISQLSSNSVEKLLIVLNILLPFFLVLYDVNGVVVGSVDYLGLGVVPTLFHL